MKGFPKPKFWTHQITKIGFRPERMAIKQHRAFVLRCMGRICQDVHAKSVGRIAFGAACARENVPKN